MKTKLSLQEVLKIAKNQLKEKKIESKELKEAWTYIQDHKDHIKEGEKPSFHLTGEIGWMNDPNGFSYFNNEYHLFYQYHPFTTKWGPMHWGHGVTKDFIKWEQRPVALAPDQKYDSEGCFSGSGIQVEDLHVLMYTGLKDPDFRRKLDEEKLDNKEKQEEEQEKEEEQNKEGSPIRQTQGLAIGDGTRYVKIQEEPIIGTHQIPEGASLVDFRDPKIWKKGEYFYSVIASREENGSGQILLYKSHNLVDWECVGTLARSHNKIGRIWECPDLFELQGQDVLILSPQELEIEEYRFHNRFGTVYMIGKLNYETGEYTYEGYEEIDYGLDFYAPQTLETPDGRRIMVAWMQCWERPIPSEKLGWAGAMTLPRELTIEEGKLIQRPVRELEKYKTNEVAYHQVIVKEEMELEGIKGRKIQLDVELQLPTESVQGTHFEMKLMKAEESYVSIQYCGEKGILIFDRSQCSDKIEGLNVRTTPVELEDHKLNLTIIMDTFSVEIFVNGGKKTMTSTAYTDLKSEGISFASSHPVTMNVKKWDIQV